MKPNLFVAVLAASAIGGACFAQSAPAAGAAPTPTAVASASVPAKHGYDPNTVICKWTDEIGTRLGRTKTCLTRAQWEQETRDSQDDLNDSVHRGAEAAAPGS